MKNEQIIQQKRSLRHKNIPFLAATSVFFALFFSARLRGFIFVYQFLFQIQLQIFMTDNEDKCKQI